MTAATATAAAGSRLCATATSPRPAATSSPRAGIA